MSNPPDGHTSVTLITGDEHKSPRAYPSVGLVGLPKTGLVFKPNFIEAKSGGVLSLLDQSEPAAEMGRAELALLETNCALKRVGADVQNHLDS